MVNRGDFMVKYDRLWETMNRNNVSQYRLIKYYGVSSGQIGRLKKNMYVSTHTIEMLCSILNCSVEEVMEVSPEVIHPRQTLQRKNSSKRK